MQQNPVPLILPEIIKTKHIILSLQINSKQTVGTTFCTDRKATHTHTEHGTKR
jgi:hypothetical protein